MNKKKDLNKQSNTVLVSIFIVISYILFLTYFVSNKYKLISAFNFYKDAFKEKQIPKIIKIFDKDNKLLYSGTTFHYCIANKPDSRCILFLDKSLRNAPEVSALLSVDGKKIDNFLLESLDQSLIINFDHYSIIIPKNNRLNSLKEIALMLENNNPLFFKEILEILSVDEQFIIEGLKEYSYREKQFHFPELDVKRNGLFKIEISYSCINGAVPKFILSDKLLTPNSILKNQILECEENQLEYYFTSENDGLINTLTLRNESKTGFFDILNFKMYYYGVKNPHFNYKN